MPKKPTYKDINGTTRVGDFLREIGNTKLLNKVFGAGAELITGDVKGAIEVLIQNDQELSADQRAFALQLLESDVKENEEVTKRWQYDMQSDSKLAKIVRPIILLYLTFVMSLLVVLDSALENFVVAVAWISLFTTLLVTVYVAYFGGRSYEKSKKL